MKKVKLYAALILTAILTVLLFSCSHEDGKAVMVVGGNRVSYDEYRYFYMNLRDSHESKGETDYSAKIKSEIEDTLKLKYAKVNLAKEKDVKLSEENLTAVDNMEQYYIDSYGSEEQFTTAIAENYLTSSLFRSMLEFQGLDEILRDYMCDEYTGEILSDDKTVEQYIKDNFIHATHILIRADEGDDLAVNKQLAREAQLRASAGEDFDALIAQYNEDPAMSDGDTTGYYFVEGQLIQEFEDAAKALAIGEISDVVLSENGYHIIKRLPLDDDYINEHFEELRDIYKAKMYNDLVEKLASETEVRYLDYYDTLTDEMLVEGLREKKG